MIGDLIYWKEFNAHCYDFGIIIDICDRKYKIKWFKYNHIKRFKKGYYYHHGKRIL